VLREAGLLERQRRHGHTYYRATHNAVAQFGGLGPWRGRSQSGQYPEPRARHPAGAWGRVVGH
jgi:hypothetical protein